MKVINRKTAEIIPYSKNTKKHDQTQIDNVARSIQQYGFVQPLVVDRDNVVVIGHCRLMAAEQLGMEEVPCVCVDDLTPQQVNALRVVDNATNESEWDKEMLSGVLDGIDLDGFDLDFSFLDEGSEEFDENALNEMFADAPEKEKEPKRIKCPHCGEWFEA